ncbi:type II secretion system F family protein [Actinomyces slackii]|uniref:Flp pilus assembly protein TadB n=1 Tax=Actinomyces slackii TaxID=52774 RepID=A0A448KCW1_9ACTO|nr:type II secretion system F family protein [Actinomyces slackii]VEG74763.1 Flp pilus assembly protein TadB [Actinomyces slackii]
MGAIAGLVGGVGLLLIWLACTSDPPQWRSKRSAQLADLLIQAGAGRTSPAMFVAGSAALGLVVGLAFLGVSRAWPVAAAFAVIFSGAPYLLVSSRARSRRTRLREIWPEAVDTLVSGVRAGMSLPEALANLGERGPEAVRPQFRAFAADYAATARFDHCLDRLKARFADPVADRIVEALRLAHEVGGTDLGSLLRALSRMLREDMRTRGELQARQSWTVNGAKVAVAAPWLVLALLSTRPQAATAYATSAGALVLAVGGVVSVIAYRLMLRLGRLPEEERTLR